MSAWLQWIAEAMLAGPGVAVVSIFGASLALAALSYAIAEARARSRARALPPMEGAATPEPQTVDAGSATAASPDETASARPPVAEPLAAAPAPPAEAVAEAKPEPEPAPEPEPEAPPASLRDRLRRTSDALVGRLGGLLGREADPALFEELEALLFTADLGVRTAEDLLERARREAGGRDGAAVRSVLRTAIAEKLRSVEPAGDALRTTGKPHVILVLGVNGSGKTTTIGKLAARYQAAGKTVVLGAGDTFRAAAREQLQRWGERVGCDVIVGPDDGDPAAVAFDTVKAATARGIDIALIDTAGRLQNQAPLMEELSKIARVLGRDVEGAPHETLLVLDSNTGQNALSQARQFAEAAPVTGLVLTKLDGTAKGGVIIGLADELAIPVKHVGVGEGVDDLRDFSADEFVDALFAD